MIKKLFTYCILKYENLNLLNIPIIKKRKDWLIERLTTSELQRQKKGNSWIDKELEKILTLQDLLSDIRIILILPDRTPNTISKAHKLAPRFLTYLDSDFGEIKAVLHKMLKSLRSSQIEGEV